MTPTDYSELCQWGIPILILILVLDCIQNRVEITSLHNAIRDYSDSHNTLFEEHMLLKARTDGTLTRRCSPRIEAVKEQLYHGSMQPKYIQ